MRPGGVRNHSPYLKGIQRMKRISIERYKTPVDGYSGLIEGETDDGSQWIMYIDAEGRPEVFWPKRDQLGGVEDGGINLRGEFASVMKRLGVEEGQDDPDGVVASFPVWDDGMRGMIFAVVPRQHERDNTTTRLIHFVNRLNQAFERDPGKTWTDGWEISDEDRQAASFDSDVSASQPTAQPRQS